MKNDDLFKDLNADEFTGMKTRGAVETVKDAMRPDKCPKCGVPLGWVKIFECENCYKPGPDLDDIIAGFDTLCKHYRGHIEVHGFLKAREFVTQLARFIESNSPLDDSIFTAKGTHLITEIFSK